MRRHRFWGADSREKRTAVAGNGAMANGPTCASSLRTCAELLFAANKLENIGHTQIHVVASFIREYLITVVSQNPAVLDG